MFSAALANFLTEVDGIKVMVADAGATSSVVGINICHWIDAKADINDDYDVITTKLDAWMKEHNFMYYGAPRDSFNEWKGLAEAKEKGFAGIVMEDLS